MTKFFHNLEYAVDSLEPYISKESMEIHHGTHYKKYCDNLVKLIKDTKYEKLELMEIIIESEPLELPYRDPIYNNAAQIFNHEFYFSQFLGTDPDFPTDELGKEIDKEFGSFDKFQKVFKDKVTGHFGSGWVWLVLEQHRQWDSPQLSIMTSINARTFIPEDTDEHFIGPLMVCDVWEHAYYIDHRADRGKYLESFWKALHWEIVQDRYNQAAKGLFDYTKPFEL